MVGSRPVGVAPLRRDKTGGIFGFLKTAGRAIARLIGGERVNRARRRAVTGAQRLLTRCRRCPAPRPRNDGAAPGVPVLTPLHGVTHSARRLTATRPPLLRACETDGVVNRLKPCRQMASLAPRPIPPRPRQRAPAYFVLSVGLFA